MSVSASYSLTWNKDVIERVKRNTVKGLYSMGAAISEKAKNNAPWLSGDLSRSIRVTTESDTVYVLAGGKANGKTIAYARLREYVNRAHPSTRYYMRRAFEAVAGGDYSKHFKEITK